MKKCIVNLKRWKPHRDEAREHCGWERTCCMEWNYNV